MIAGVCERAAGKSPPIAPPTTDTTDLKEEEETEEVFRDTLSPPFQSSAMADSQPVTQVMIKSQVGEEDMENFEADLLAQETEDRLTQLMLDDELSDARLGLTVDSGAELALSHTSLSAPFASSVVVPSDKTLLEVAKQNLTPSQEQSEHIGSKSVVMATHEELTLDVKEKERLEDSLTIAG